MLTIEEIDALIADRARYRAVVRALVRWDAPPAGQDATYHELVKTGCEAIASESVKATHQMVTGFGLPSPYSDDHKWCKTTPLAERRRVIRFCETTDTQAKDWAMRVIEAAKVLEADSEFKNFHRLLCERFGYGHDPRNWRRDQLSLIEHIANSQAKPGEKP